MLILTKSVMALIIGFILAVIVALILIPFLKKEKASQSISIYFYNGITATSTIIY